MGDALININGDSIQTLQLLFLLTSVSLLPSIIVMMTSFTRIIIVLSFVRNALGIQQTPPNTVLIGIAIFLTLFIMAPVTDEITQNAYEPLRDGVITQEVALERAQAPLKVFMLKQTEIDTLDMFMTATGQSTPENEDEIPLRVVIPAFMTSELKRAFTMGFLLLIPFLLIDVVVASTLMSMGMIMLPPTMISLPFKILLFVTLDGWTLLFSTLMRSFN